MTVYKCNQLTREVNVNTILFIILQIGDEYHYIFECIYFNQKRKQSLLNYFIYIHNIIKFSELMSGKRKPILKKLCHFISAINTGVCPPGS